MTAKILSTIFPGRKSGLALFILMQISLLFIQACGQSTGSDEDVSFFLKPIPGQVKWEEGKNIIKSPALLEDESHFVWGGSVARGPDGRYHMFYAVFDSGPDQPPFQDAWLLSSKIAYAVSDYPDRGFTFQKIVLRGASSSGRPEAWDAQGVHNPHIRQFAEKYYLYYIGSRDPGPRSKGDPGFQLSKRNRIQQLQQIGVIAADSLDDLINGRFVRPGSPLLSPRTRVKAGDIIDPSPAGTSPKPDNIIVVNPSVVFRPADRKYLLYFKGNLYDPGWRGVHGVAIGDSPTGPYTAMDDFVFDVRTPDGKIASAEDPYVWYMPRTGSFYAVFKDFSGRFTGAKPGLAVLTSIDGIEWRLPKNPLFSLKQLIFSDGKSIPVSNLERPQLLIDESGIPRILYAACSITPLAGKTDGSTFNVQIGISSKFTQVR